MTTGERIKELRKQAGYTQKDFGKKINKSAQVVSNWERGYTTGITDNDISAMAAVLGVTTDYLLGRSPSPAAPASRPHAPAYNKTPALSEKDEREISRDLEDMIHTLDGAAAMGQAEDDEDRELLMASLRQAMVLSKRIAKKKFTPKKYRDEP